MTITDLLQVSCFKHSYNKTNLMHQFLKFIFGIKLYIFRAVPRTNIRSLLTACQQAVSKPVWHIPLLCVQWKTPDDGQRNCPKHVEVYSKNKFEKLVHLLGFIIRIYHDGRSPERYNHSLYKNFHFTSLHFTSLHFTSTLFLNIQSPT